MKIKIENYQGIVSYADLLARNDLSLRYANSALGPFWVTLQMAIFVVGVGVVFSGVFDVPLQSFLPYLAISITIWNFFSSCITDSTMSIQDGSAFIKDRGVKPIVFLFKVYLRNFYMLLHNIIVPSIMFLFFSPNVFLNFFLALPGMIIFLIITALAIPPIAFLATRFRDLKPMVESVVQLSFLLTPIMWQPQAVAGRDYILDYNPIAALYSIWREPFLGGEMSSLHNWIFTLIILLFLLILNFIVYRYYSRLAFWV